MNITDLLDRPIAYHRIFVTLTGSVKAAILLSQAMYWQKRAKQADGWWYKTAEEWTEETGLTRHEQDTAREACKDYLKTDLRDAPARLYWHVDDERLSADLFAINGQSSLTKSGKLDSRNSSNINKKAETTTETTTEEISGDDTKIFTALESLTGSLNSNTPKFVDTWLEKHTPEWILKAIGIASENKARSVKYVDTILVGWEADGYPKTRDEKIRERKQQSSKQPQPPQDNFMAELAAKKQRLQQEANA